MRNAEWLQSNKFELLIKGFEQKGWQVKYKAFGEEYTRQFSMEQTSYLKGILEGGEEIRRIYDLWAITIDFTIWEKWQSGQKEVRTFRNDVSSNIIPRILDDKDCRFLMNELFGQYETSVMAAYYQPPKLLTSSGEFVGGKQNHENSELATHIYGGDDGSKKGAPFYIPANSDGSAPLTLGSIIGETSERNGKTTTYITGIREEGTNRIVEKIEPGTSTSNVFKYNNGLVIVANHIDKPDENYKRGKRNRQGSFQVGFIGGAGGGLFGQGLFNHVHMSFYRYSKAGKKYMRVDPRYEFCSGKYYLK
jgi:hypothetical protein